MGRQPPLERSAESEAGSFGTWLRRQRELREISLRYLEAMEDDRFDLLPAPVFAKGFLREYARYIGLSPDEVVNHYLSVHGLDGSETGGEDAAPLSPAAPPHRRLWIALALALLAALAVAAFLYYERAMKPRGAAAPDAAGTEASAAASTPSTAPEPLFPADSEPLPSEAAAEPEAPRSPIEVTLDFTRDCWVEATVDGKPTIAEQRVAGESLQIPAQQEVILKLGNASGVEAQVNGYPFALPPGQGQVVRDLKIDLETVRALREKKATG